MRYVNCRVAVCLAVPARVLCREGDMAVVEIDGVRRGVSLTLIPETVEGDWILLHAGHAIERIDEEEARKTLEVLRAIEDVAAKDGARAETPP